MDNHNNQDDSEIDDIESFLTIAIDIDIQLRTISDILKWTASKDLSIEKQNEFFEYLKQRAKHNASEAKDLLVFSKDP